MQAAERSWETIDDSGPLAGRAAALARNVKGTTAAIEMYARSGLIGRRVDAQADELAACVAALDGRMAEARPGFREGRGGLSPAWMCRRARPHGDRTGDAARTPRQVNGSGHR